jgi:hypothetical protein
MIEDFPGWPLRETRREDKSDVVCEAPVGFALKLMAKDRTEGRLEELAVSMPMLS